jgi:hypothetical protein
VSGLGTRQGQFVPIILKVIAYERFGHSATWPAKVRNVQTGEPLLEPSTQFCWQYRDWSKPRCPSPTAGAGESESLALFPKTLHFQNREDDTSAKRSHRKHQYQTLLPAEIRQKTKD